MNLFATRKPRGFYHQMIYCQDDKNDNRGSMHRDYTPQRARTRRPHTLSITALLVILVLLVVVMILLTRF